LDGTGARVAELADELLASIAEPLEVVRTRQAEELALLQEQAERRGENNIPGRSIIEDRHNRELRRVRTDEIRAGLAALSSVCRARLTEPEVAPQRLRSTLAAIAAIDEASTRLSRNVNATMLLQWLLLHLDT
jgi:DNA polymerase-3 subunit delta'